MADVTQAQAWNPGGVSRQVDPPGNSWPITPSDSADLALGPSANTTPRALYVGVGGDVAGVLFGDYGTARVFKNVPSGTTLPFRFRRVYATGTTALSLVGVW